MTITISNPYKGWGRANVKRHVVTRIDHSASSSGPEFSKVHLHLHYEDGRKVHLLLDRDDAQALVKSVNANIAWLDNAAQRRLISQEEAS